METPVAEAVPQDDLQAAPKKSRARKPRKTSNASPEDLFINRKLAVLVKTYCEKIRPHSVQETKGVIAQMRRLLAKGISYEQLETAVRNYAADPFTVGLDPRVRKNIRSFFAEANIRLWQKPIPQRGGQTTPARAPQLDVLERLESLG